MDQEMYNTKEYKILYFYFSFACLNFVFPSSTVLAKPQVAAVGTVGEEGNAADSCQDLREECAELAEDGGCEGNVEFMEVFCQQTCDTCRPRSKVSGCEDQREECGFWGVTGQCDFNPAYMNINCPVTCQACPPLTPEDCVDQHRFCFLGSLLGLCRTNPSFYLVFCGDSCRRFISVCRAGRSSAVPELCLSKVRGEGIQCGKKPNITSTVNENTASYLRQRRGVGVSHQPQENDSCSTLPLNSAGREAITLLLSDYDAAGMQDENELEHWIKSVLLVFLERVQMEVLSMTDDEEREDVLWKDSEILRRSERETKLLRNERQAQETDGVFDYDYYDPTGDNINGGNGNITEPNGNNTHTNFCIMPLIGTNTSVNICAVIVPLVPVIVIGIINAVFTALSASSIAQQRPPSRPPMNQPFTPSEQQPTPQQPLSSIDVKVRALVPFCTASGYLSLVRRLRRLIRGNTGRPLNPIAASLAVSVNFCQYGVGKRGMSVPDPPRQLQQLSVAQVFLNDNEANAALGTPHRWPGISFPGLELFQGGQTPPPPVSPDVPTGTLLNDTQVEGEEPAGPRPVTEDNVNDRDAFSCGGALISPYHVVTAAHCLLEPGVKGNNTVNFLKPSVVRLGEVDFTRADESQAFDYEVEGIQVHEGYALPAKYNDIAIITLKYPVQFTEALQPYCLPRVGIDLVGRPLTMSGWGVRPGGQVATILHNITVRVVSEDECSDAYDDDDISVFFEVLYPEGVNKLLMCATSEEPVCRGDSGGPLVLDEEQIQYEVGVVSTGYGCGASQYPGIYTNISQFLTWIEEEVYDGCSMMSVAY
ncbi:uncharacterized protein LOC123509353 [Portunus trituberculatus]|uniref:uncharacterized protein LOC123509353 n=1 Tax=Portunus trituberculatus TaxID=210409 RepID=UPI001E1D0E96|nr:uncharacterized protein LOC123509353 [Portunus trituberculatus]